MKRLMSPLLIAITASALVFATTACDKKNETPPAADQPAADEPKPDEPKPDEPKPDEPKPDEPADEPKPDEPADEPAADEPTADEPAADEPAADEPAADEPAADEAKADTFIKFDVDHHDDKGMVNGHFERFEVVRANVDLAEPSNASAVIHIDLASVKTGIPKRDAHVISGDFFDTANFATATVTVNEVAAAEEADTYTAQATLDFKGVSKTFPVTFKVVEKKEDGSVIIEGEHKGLARADFNVGGAPEETNVAPTIDTVKVRLHLANKE